MCDKIRTCAHLVMDSLLAIIEIFQVLLTHG